MGTVISTKLKGANARWSAPPSASAPAARDAPSRSLTPGVFGASGAAGVVQRAELRAEDAADDERQAAGGAGGEAALQGENEQDGRGLGGDGGREGGESHGFLGFLGFFGGADGAPGAGRGRRRGPSVSV